MTIGDTDVVPQDEVEEPGYGFWARLVGMPLQELRLIRAFERMLAANAADQASLVKSLGEFRAADTTVDSIEPAPFNHTKGTNP